MNQSKYIQELLEKYWEAETSITEEKILQTYFESDEIPVEFAKYKSLFVAKNQSQNTSLSSDFEANILAVLEEKENIVPIQITEPAIVKSQNAEIKKLRWLAGIAAGIALILSVYIAMPKDSLEEFAFNNQSKLTEAEHKKALKAYKQTKTVLFFVSQKMNEGTAKAAESLNKVPNLSETIQEIE